MAMILARTSLPASEKLHGEEGGVAVSAGQSFRIETSPGGADVLDAECPVGKAWVITVSVNIDETDA